MPSEPASPSAAGPAGRSGNPGFRDTLDMLRRYAKPCHDAALNKACELLARGRSPEQALEFLAYTLTNKLLHAPSASLRAASLRGDVNLLRKAEQLFADIGGGSRR
jgi:glutamyl-tRNA reductase